MVAPIARLKIYVTTVLLVVLVGCGSRKSAFLTSELEPASLIHSIHYPPETPAATADIVATSEPRTPLTEIPIESWDLTLDEAIILALKNTEVLRSLGGAIVDNRQFASGSFDPALQSTNPNSGIEAALADFDTQVSSSLFLRRNDNVFNNPVLGGGVNEVRDDVVSGLFSIDRIAPTGTNFSLASSVDHSQSNNPNLLFPHSWTTTWEATVRQPLLQGRGVRFNRIAGPNNRAGFRLANGIVIRRINHDISIAQFERQLRDMVREITNAYWQLYLAYENFNSIRGIRDVGLSTWNIAKNRSDAELPGGEADREAQAREQYYQFKGSLLESQNTVLQSEANLRRLLNLSQSDERLIKPSEKPFLAKIQFSWEQLAKSTLNSRVELREQAWLLKRRELELESSRNFLMPRLDAVATYRNNGFGDDLIGGSNRFASAFTDAISNDHGEWELGLAYDVVLGRRQTYVAIRHAELALCNEKAVLQEQQKQILHDLGTAKRQVDQRFLGIEVATERLEAARNTEEARTTAFEAEAAGFEDLLNAQQRLLQAELSFHQAVVDYETSKEDLLSESGRLLFEHGINLQEATPCTNQFCN